VSKQFLYLLTILESIEKIFIYSADYKSGAELYTANDQLNFNAVIKLISVIGEEVSKLDTELLPKDGIDWLAIKSTRNRIVHDYRGIDQEIIYSIIKDELPKLKLSVVRHISSFDIPPDLLELIKKSDYYRHIRSLFQ
jgi:uncharacterized protein with HEPN domain